MSHFLFSQQVLATERQLEDSLHPSKSDRGARTQNLLLHRQTGQCPLVLLGLLSARLGLTILQQFSRSSQGSGCNFQLPWRPSKRKDAKLLGQEPEVLRVSHGSHQLNHSSSEMSRNLGGFLEVSPSKRSQLGSANEKENTPLHLLLMSLWHLPWVPFCSLTYSQLLAVLLRDVKTW